MKWFQALKTRAKPQAMTASNVHKSSVGGEGTWRGPFWGFGEWGHGFELDPLEDGWQRNLSVGGREAWRVSAVYACVMMTARAVSQCTPLHLVENQNGEQKPNRTSAAARVMRNPNPYETFTQLSLNTVCELLFSGESIWYGVRDERYNITQAHRIPYGEWQVFIDTGSGEIFYGINPGGNPLVKIPDVMVPARDVVHFRQHCPRNGLAGESPIAAASLAIGLNVALARSQLSFFSKANRPSGVMTTDMTLTSDQMRQLREAFNEQSKNEKAGGVPILGGGLKFQAMGLSQNDSQLIEQQKMSVAEIARVFGVPITMISDAGGPQGGTEAMISHWLSIGLGSVIETMERSLDRFFNLPVGQAIELDPAPLLRVDFAAQIDGLTKSIQGGLMSVNEARQRMRRGLPKVEYGDMPALQQQMVPLDLLHAIHVAEIGAKTTPAPEPTPEPPAEPETATDEKMEKAYAEYLLRGFIDQGAAQ